MKPHWKLLLVTITACLLSWTCLVAVLCSALSLVVPPEKYTLVAISQYTVIALGFIAAVFALFVAGRIQNKILYLLSSVGLEFCALLVVAIIYGKLCVSFSILSRSFVGAMIALAMACLICTLLIVGLMPTEWIKTKAKDGQQTSA